MNNFEMKVYQGEDVEAYIDDLVESSWAKGEHAAVAKDTFWQLHDFDYEAVVVIKGDVHLKKHGRKTYQGKESFYSCPYKDLLTPETTGLDPDKLKKDKILLIIDGNVRAESNISFSLCIITGNLECENLYVYGEALLVNFGNCKAKSIYSSYNGVCSAIRSAETNYVILSREEMLKVHEAKNDLLCFDEWLSVPIEENLIKDEIVSSNDKADEFLNYIKNDKNPFVNDLSFDAVKQKLASKSVIKKGSHVTNEN